MTAFKNQTSSLSLVIPCYNEGKNISLIYDRLYTLLQNRGDVQVVLVDNGSIDASFENISEILGEDSHFKVCKVEKNQGYGYGILKGLEASDGSVLAWTHADMQTDPKDVLTAYDLYLSSANSPKKVVVKGKRRNRKALESFFTWGMQVIAAQALRTPLDDINAQPKLFSREFYSDCLKKEAPWDFSLDLFWLYQAHKCGYEILTVPVDFGERIHGEAKGGGSWKTRQKLIKRTFKYIFELKKKVQAL